jgi:hypothetical protein
MESRSGDNVHHQAQRPQARAENGERAIYTIVAHLPIEADERIRYRIKGKNRESLAGRD